MHAPLQPFHRAVDWVRHEWDTAPACVLSHGVGRGADANCQVGIGAVPVLNEDRDLAHHRQLSV